MLLEDTGASDFVRTLPFSYIQKGFEMGCSVTAFRERLTSTAGSTVNLTPRNQPLLQTLAFDVHKRYQYKFLFHQYSNPLQYKLWVFTAVLVQPMYCINVGWNQNSSTHLASAHQALKETVQFCSALSFLFYLYFRWLRLPEKHKSPPEYHTQTNALIVYHILV